MGSAFTQVLANIYMYEWEQDLIKYQKSNNEIYGKLVLLLMKAFISISIDYLYCRYIDDIFMTTNETEDNIRKMLDKENHKDINIKINYQISESVDFLDVTIENVNSHLRTVLYHKLAAEPYILPITSEHPRHILRNIPYAALLRTARVCSDVNDFDAEKHNIMISLLLNGYPPNFIEKCFERFFTENAATSVLYDLNQSKYRTLREKLLQQPTRREEQLKLQLIDPITPTVLQPKVWDKSVMYPRYSYHSAISTNLTAEFHRWWQKYFLEYHPQLRKVTVHMKAVINQTLQHSLVNKKPLKSILKSNASNASIIQKKTSEI